MTTESKIHTTEPTLGGKHSVLIRLWHWSTYIIIFGSLITVLLAKTVLSTSAAAPTVQQTLQKNNVPPSPELTKSITHGFTNIIWSWHTYIGYVLAALFGFRILLEFFELKEKKLIPALRNATKYLKQPGMNKKDTKYFLFIKSLYLFFYVALLVQVCTGLFMAYSDGNASLKSIRHTASDVHSILMWIIIAYIVLHISGVVRAELGKKHKGIVSGMINGGK